MSRAAVLTTAAAIVAQLDELPDDEARLEALLYAGADLLTDDAPAAPAPSSAPKAVEPAPKRAGADKTFEAIIECVRAAGGQAELRWVAETLDLSTQCVGKHIRDAVAAGRLERTARGVVRIPKGAYRE